MPFTTWSPFSPGGFLGPHAKTYIKNDYHEAIWVNVSVDITHIKVIDAEMDAEIKAAKLKGKVSVQLFHELAEKKGYTKVAPDSATLFTPGNGTVYISIWKDSGELICSSFTRPQNGSAMVDAGGYVRAGIDGDGKD